jgi:hypothetical protein
LSKPYCPRLSEARHLLPLVRGHLMAAAARFPLPNGLKIELLPIVEDGLFGYELVPDRRTHTYVTLGCDPLGEPLLRKTLYGDGARNALQLVPADGRVPITDGRAARFGARHRDTHFPDLPAAVEAAWAQLLVLFPDRPRQPVAVPQHALGCLDEALSIAHTYLEQWNPFIHFFGVPNEAQLGFALTGAGGQHGELVFQRPDIWMLRWKAPPQVVYESWSVVLPDTDSASDTSHLYLAS